MVLEREREREKRNTERFKNGKKSNGVLKQHVRFIFHYLN